MAVLAERKVAFVDSRGRVRQNDGKRTMNIRSTNQGVTCVNT